jgi:hypothetical protein
MHAGDTYDELVTATQASSSQRQQQTPASPTSWHAQARWPGSVLKVAVLIIYQTGWSAGHAGHPGECRRHGNAQALACTAVLITACVQDDSLLLNTAFVNGFLVVVKTY